MSIVRLTPWRPRTIHCVKFPGAIQGLQRPNCSAEIRRLLADAAEPGGFEKLARATFFGQDAAGQAAAEQYLRMIAGATDRGASAEVNAQQSIAAKHYYAMDVFSALAGSSNFVIFIAGQDDLIVPNVNSRKLVGQLPNSRLTIMPDTGHAPIFQYPSQCSKVIRNYFDVTADRP